MFTVSLAVPVGPGLLKQGARQQDQRTKSLALDPVRVPTLSTVSIETQTGILPRPQNISPRRVTLADVARDAGVHKATASRALRGLPGVDDATRSRIKDSARRLHYSASVVAMALATGRSRTIGLVLPTLRWWHFSEVAAGASEVLIAAGYRVELINLDIDSDLLKVDSAPFRELFEELGAAHARDALLFTGTITHPAGLSAGQATVPAAAAGTAITSVPGLFIDNRRGGQMVGEHFKSLGHTRAAVMDGQMRTSSVPCIWSDRTQGFLDVFSDAQIIPAGDCHATDGQLATQRMIGSGNPLPSALFCHTDDMAFGVMSALRKAGIHCPDEISVAAFDDHPMSQYWGLTTVSQHAHQQGVRSARALLHAIRGEDTRGDPAPTHDLDVELLVRETTGPPPTEFRGGRLLANLAPAK